MSRKKNRTNSGPNRLESQDSNQVESQVESAEEALESTDEVGPEPEASPEVSEEVVEESAPEVIQEQPAAPVQVTKPISADQFAQELKALGVVCSQKTIQNAMAAGMSPQQLKERIAP